MTQTSIATSRAPGKDRATHLIARYRVDLPAHYLSLLERTEDPVRIRGTRYARYTFRGVPGRIADVIVAEAIERHAYEAREATLAERHARTPDLSVVLDVSDQRPQALPPALADVVLELGDRAGKFDGAVRRRYALRYFSDAAAREAIPRAKLRIIREEDQDARDGRGSLLVIVRPEDGSAPHVDDLRMLRSDLEDYALARVAGWHWRRFYPFLTDQEQMRAWCDAWAAEVQASGEANRWTLAEANRAASRALYRLARDLGWTKLTADQRAELGYPDGAGQWQRSDEVGALIARIRSIGSPTGCGEGTLTAAATGHWPALDAQDATDAELMQLDFDLAYQSR